MRRVNSIQESKKTNKQTVGTWAQQPDDFVRIMAQPIKSLSLSDLTFPNCKMGLTAIPIS